MGVPKHSSASMPTLKIELPQALHSGKSSSSSSISSNSNSNSNSNHNPLFLPSHPLTPIDLTSKSYNLPPRLKNSLRIQKKTFMQARNKQNVSAMTAPTHTHTHPHTHTTLKTNPLPIIAHDPFALFAKQPERAHSFRAAEKNSGSLHLSIFSEAAQVCPQPADAAGEHGGCEAGQNISP